MVSFVKKSEQPEVNEEQETTVPVIDGDALAEAARDLGSRVGEASETAIGLVMKAKEDWQGGPFKVLFGLMSDFTEDELNGFAVPDSETGNNPDVFKVHKENAKGKQSLVNSNFYVQFSDGTPSGQNILSRIEWVERMADKNAMKDDIPDDIREMDPHQREVHLNFLKGRRATIRQSYKNAMALHFKLQEVNEYPGVKAEPIWVKGKSPTEIGEGELPEVENTTKPIAVWLVPDEGRPIVKWEAFSIGSFKKLNVKKAMEKGGTFQSLIESGATVKAPGTAGAPSATEGLTIHTIERGVSFIAELHRWMTEIGEEKSKEQIGLLYKLANAKDNDEFVTAVFELHSDLGRMIKDTGLGAKYLKLQQAGSDLVREATDKGTKAA